VRGCAARFTTFERIQLRESDGGEERGPREPFERDKLIRSVSIAAASARSTVRRSKARIGIQRQLETRATAKSARSASARW
jgi:transcriptional repressor NrdR